MNRKTKKKYRSPILSCFCRCLTTVVLVCLLGPPFLSAMGIEEYRDTFSVQVTTWPQREDRDMKVAKVDGGYIVEGRNKTAAGMVGCTIDLRRDFDIETTLAFLSGSDDIGYGLVWGADNRRSLYYFFISANGSYCFGKVVRDEDNPLIEWEPSSFIQMGGPNTLRVRKTGDTLHLFINNQPVTQVKAEAPFGHLFGIAANSGLAVKVLNFFVRGHSPDVPAGLSTLYEGNLLGRATWRNIQNPKHYTVKLQEKSRVAVYRPVTGETLTVSATLSASRGGENVVDIYLQTEEGALLRLERIAAASGLKVRFSASSQGKDLGSNEISLPNKDVTLRLIRQQDTFRGEAQSGGKNLEVGSLSWPKLSTSQLLGINFGYDRKGPDGPRELTCDISDFILGNP